MTWTNLFGYAGIAPNYDGGSGFYSTCLSLEWNGEFFMAGGDQLYGQPVIFYYFDTTLWRYAVVPNGFTNGTGVVAAIKWNGTYWIAAGIGNTANGNGLLQLAYQGPVVGFTVSVNNFNGSYKGLAWNGRLWVSAATNGFIYSYNGTTWTVVDPNSASSPPLCVTWDGVRFIGGTGGFPGSGAGGNVFVSFDGLSWEGVASYGAFGVAIGVRSLISNNLRRRNRMLIAAGSDTPTTTFGNTGSSITTSDLEIVDTQNYFQGGYKNFSIRID